MNKIKNFKQDLKRIQSLLESYEYAISLRELPTNFLNVVKIMSTSLVSQNGEEFGINLKAMLKSENRKGIEKLFSESAHSLAEEYIKICQEIAKEDDNIHQFIQDDDNAELLSKIFFCIKKAVNCGLLKYKQVVDSHSLKLFFENTILEVRVPQFVN